MHASNEGLRAKLNRRNAMHTPVYKIGDEMQLAIGERGSLPEIFVYYQSQEGDRGGWWPATEVRYAPAAGQEYGEWDDYDANFRRIAPTRRLIALWEKGHRPHLAYGKPGVEMCVLADPQTKEVHMLPSTARERAETRRLGVEVNLAPAYTAQEARYLDAIYTAREVADA